MVMASNRFRLLLLAVAGLSCFSQSRAPISQQLTFAPDHPGGIYEANETVGWTITPGPVQPSYAYKGTIRQNNAIVLKEGTLDLSKGSDKIEIKAREPGMIYLAIEPYAMLDSAVRDTAGFTGGNTGRNNGLYAAGAAVSVLLPRHHDLRIYRSPIATPPETLL